MLPFFIIILEITWICTYINDHTYVVYFALELLIDILKLYFSNKCLKTIETKETAFFILRGRKVFEAVGDCYRGNTLVIRQNYLSLIG